MHGRWSCWPSYEARVRRIGCGSSIVREGKGKIVERLYREVRMCAWMHAHVQLNLYGWIRDVTPQKRQGSIPLSSTPQVRSTAIPGGSEEIMMDFAMRQVVACSRPVIPPLDLYSCHCHSTSCRISMHL